MNDRILVGSKVTVKLIKGDAPPEPTGQKPAGSLVERFLNAIHEIQGRKQHAGQAR